MPKTYHVELVMSEFGSSRGNSSLSAVPNARFEPTLASFRAIFPDASVRIYTDDPELAVHDAAVELVRPPFEHAHPRYGWRSHDYYQAIGLLRSEADIAIAMDADMQIVSSRFAAITVLAERFGLAVPINPRLTVGIDGSVGSDSSYDADADVSQGLAIGYNLTPIAFSTSHRQARTLLETYAALMERTPGRGAVHLTAATLAIGYQPHPLPFQWCACSPKDLDSPHIWRDAVALHVGHDNVLPYWQGFEKRQARSERWLKLRRGLAKMRGRR